MSLGKAYVLPCPEEFTPTVLSVLGYPDSQPRFSVRGPMTEQESSAPTPSAYLGTYPVMQGDENFVAWATPCDPEATQ
jgi:hypothetical protein